MIEMHDVAREYTRRAGTVVLTCGSKSRPARLIKPKCFGRALRCAAKYYAAVLAGSEGIANSQFLRCCLIDADVEFAEFEKQLESKWFPKKLSAFAPIVRDFHAIASNLMAADVADLQRLHRHARTFGFYEGVHRNVIALREGRIYRDLELSLPIGEMDVFF